jgi:DNA-binding IclR family transcriptional regulator
MVSAGNPRKAEKSYNIELRLPTPNGTGSGDSLVADRDRSNMAMAVRPVQNAIRILRYLNEVQDPPGATQIARAIGINLSTCFYILQTMVSEGVLAHEPSGKTYAIGLGLAQLAQNLRYQRRADVLKSEMARLAARFAVTITLWKRTVPDRVTLVDRICSPADLRIEMAVGQRFPILSGASGRLFASRLSCSKVELRAMFKKVVWQRPITFTEYWRQVEAAERMGWAIDDGYLSADVKSVAVSILDRSGFIMLCLAAVMFRDQIGEQGVTILGSELKQASLRLRSILY